MVVGGANSAGQAVVKLADHAREVHLVARRPLEAAMSRYLVDQIEAKSNVRVWSGCEVRSLEGDEKLEAVVISGAGPDRRVETSALFAMIGASPRSEGLVAVRGPGRQALRGHGRGGEAPPRLRPPLERGGPPPAPARVHAPLRLCDRRRSPRLHEARGGGSGRRRARRSLDPRLARIGPNVGQRRQEGRRQADYPGLETLETILARPRGAG